MSFCECNVIATVLYVGMCDVSTFESRTKFCKNRVVLHHERSPLLHIWLRVVRLNCCQVQSDMHDWSNMKQKYGYAKCKDTVSTTVELRDMKILFEKFEMWQSFWYTDYNVGFNTGMQLW